MNIKNTSIFLVLFFVVAINASALDIMPEVIISADKPIDMGAILADNNKIEPYSKDFYKIFITAAYYEKQGKNAEAFKLYESIYSAAPSDKAILSSLAALSLNIQNKEAMEKYVPAYYALAPQDAVAMAMQAGFLWNRGDLKGAADLYKASLDKSPDNIDTITRYVTLLSALNGDEAIIYLKQLATTYPGMGPLVSLHIADLYLKQGDKASAIKYLEDYIKSNPSAPEPYGGLVGIYEATGQAKKALETYLSMEQEGLASADILVKIGAYYTLAEKKDIAMDYFRRAKQLDNAQPAAAQFLVLDAQNKGEYSNAVKFLQESSAYDSEPSFHIRASYFLSRAGKRDESVDVLKDAYSKFPEDKEIAFYYALSLIDLQEYSKAGKMLSVLLESNPSNESILFHYSYTLERQKKYKKMETELKKLLEINPKNADALNYYGYYLIDKTKKLDEGGEYIKQAIAIMPDEPAFVDSLAWYYYKKGDYKEAYNLLGSIPVDKLTALNDIEIYLHLGQAAQALELYQEAFDYYNTVLEVDPSNKIALKNLKKVTKKIKS